MYLLDTHALIWFLTLDERLSKKAMDTICSDAPVFVSTASYWEIAIKQTLKRLDFTLSTNELKTSCDEQDISLLPIDLQHIERIKALPPIHSDPFDRLLVAQAQQENLTLITKDAVIQKYDVKTLW